MLTCVVEQDDPVVVLRPVGRLDLAGVARVRAALHKVLTDQPAAIVVDLTDLVVADDATLAVFSAFTRFATGWSGCPLLLSVPDTVVRDGLNRMGIASSVYVYDDRDSALAASRRVPPPRRFRLTVAATPPAADAARRVVRDACATWGVDHLVEDAQVIVTELVGNVVLHVGGTLALLLALRERYLHLSVRDASRTRPERRLPDVETGEGGRGLLLVDAMSAGWGSVGLPDGKVVWATLRIDGAGR